MHACSKQDEALALALAVLCMAMELLYLPIRWTGPALLQYLAIAICWSEGQLQLVPPKSEIPIHTKQRGKKGKGKKVEKHQHRLLSLEMYEYEYAMHGTHSFGLRENKLYGMRTSILYHEIMAYTFNSRKNYTI